MTWDSQAWERLGRAIRDDRERRGLSREDLAAQVVARGGSVTSRSIASLERGVAPKKRPKPPTLEPVVAALGWRPGATDRILNGEDPHAVLDDLAPRSSQGAAAAAGVKESPAASREDVLGMLPSVYAFSRSAVAAGADPRLRDQFDALADRLVASLPAAQTSGRSGYGLAAYRPHAEGEGPASDDAERIERALRGDA